MVIRELLLGLKRFTNLRAGLLEGDEEAVERFLTLFPLPEPCAPAAGV